MGIWTPGAPEWRDLKRSFCEFKSGEDGEGLYSEILISHLGQIAVQIPPWWQILSHQALLVLSPRLYRVLEIAICSCNATFHGKFPMFLAEFLISIKHLFFRFHLFLWLKSVPVPSRSASFLFISNPPIPAVFSRRFLHFFRYHTVPQNSWLPH